MEQSNSHKKLVFLKRQPLVLYCVSFISFAMILIRLIFLQLISHDTYKIMSDENRIRLIATQPIRGRILDSNGVVLADSRIKYSLIMKPQYVKKNDWAKYKFKISNLLELDDDDLQEKYFYGLNNNDLSITLLSDLTIDQVIKFKENERSFNGFEIATQLIRNYPYKSHSSYSVIVSCICYICFSIKMF